MGKARRIRLSRRQLVLLIVAAALALACALCVLGYRLTSRTLDTQKAAERWAGEGEQSFAQVSCFMPDGNTLTLNNIYAFRNEMYKKLHEAALDIDNDNTLLEDAWSCFGKVKVANGKRSGDVRVTAVGGNYFDFHPLRLVSGNYIRPDDLMKDHVMLDRDTAWLLFGGTELTGMSFRINGIPYVVAGVYEHEDDHYSKKAYGETGMAIYMSYEGYCALFDQSAGAVPDGGADAQSGGAAQTASSDAAGITCYEIVMAEPVSNFVYSAVKDKFPLGSGVIVDNSHRYDTEKIWKLAKDISSRSMQGSAVVYPYWENAARGTEDTCAFLMLGAIATGAFPLVYLIVLLIMCCVRGKNRLEDELLPAWKDKIGEAIRVRERRRWEKKHPNERKE